MAQEFFGTTSPFGTITGWEVNGDNPSTSKQRAQALGSTGDEIAYHEYDEKTSYTANYVCTTDGASIPKAGDVINGIHVDSVAVSFSNQAFVTMTLTGHKHGNANHPACRKYTGSLANVASKFGCPSTGIPGVQSIPEGAGVNSVSYTLQVNHVDVPGSSGNFLAGDNYDGNESTDIELCDTGTITAASGWSMTSNSKSKSNTGATTSSATLEHHISADTTAGA